MPLAPRIRRTHVTGRAPHTFRLVNACALAALALAAMPPVRAVERPADLDARVRAFLERNASNWQDMNVPESDGRLLHDLIVKHRFTRALEIGTSTGHSGIWIAWALSKTGGRLVTIDIDPDRHRQALANFREAGVAAYVDARLGDAHVLVPQLPGPFDFVFSDADKEWYEQYFIDVWPKVLPGGCFTAHNVTAYVGAGTRAFLARIESLPDGRTTIDRSSSQGVSITCKTPR